VNKGFFEFEEILKVENVGFFRLRSFGLRKNVQNIKKFESRKV
jgi:hypothetical protein